MAVELGNNAMVISGGRIFCRDAYGKVMVSGNGTNWAVTTEPMPEVEPQDDSLAGRLEAIGFGKLKRILHTAPVLHAGWEMDNEAWIVEMEDGQVLALTTSHGSLCEWTKAEAEQALKDTESSAAALRRALDIWPK